MDESLFHGFRHQLCDNYKSNRELPDDNLARQLEGCARLCEILGLPSFGSRVYEADDIIGTLARRLRENSAGAALENIAIVSRDKDLAQLLRHDDDILWDYQRNNKRNAADIEVEFGVTPIQIPDYLGLVGDAVDRISGIPGLGPVKGRALLQRYADLEEIYANLARVAELPVRGAGRLTALLGAHRELAYLSRRLATIVEDVADRNEVFSVVPLESLRRRPADAEGLRELLQEFRFEQGFCKSMVAALERLNAAEPS
jgi:5'-3' exonuclease